MYSGFCVVSTISSPPPYPKEFAGSFLAAAELLWCRSHPIVWVCIPRVLHSGLFYACLEWKCRFYRIICEMQGLHWVFSILICNISLEVAILIFLHVLMVFRFLHKCCILMSSAFIQPVVDAFDPRLLVSPPLCHVIDFNEIKVPVSHYKSRLSQY